MASRTIMITEDVYDELFRRKRKDESFTMVINRLIEENERPSKYFAAWSDLTQKELMSIEEARSDLRTRWDRRDP